MNLFQETPKLNKKVSEQLNTLPSTATTTQNAVSNLQVIFFYFFLQFYSIYLYIKKNIFLYIKLQNSILENVSKIDKNKYINHLLILVLSRT